MRRCLGTLAFSFESPKTTKGCRGRDGACVFGLSTTRTQVRYRSGSRFSGDGSIITPTFFDCTLITHRFLGGRLRGSQNDVCYDTASIVVGQLNQQNCVSANGGSHCRGWLAGIYPGQWIGRHEGARKPYITGRLIIR